MVELRCAVSANVSPKGDICVSASVCLAVNAESVKFVLANHLIKVGDLLFRLGLDWESRHIRLSCLHFNKFHFLQMLKIEK